MTSAGMPKLWQWEFLQELTLMPSTSGGNAGESAEEEITSTLKMPKVQRLWGIVCI